jgi:mannose-6-phosphate isomerase-like protein (cupin superfamily)
MIVLLEWQGLEVFAKTNLASTRAKEEQGGMSKKRLLLVSLAVACSAGCATTAANPKLALRYDKGLEINDLSSLMRRAGPGPVVILDLGRTAWVSEHLAVVREGEVPHYHRFHDLTVSVLRGEGVMDVEGRRFAVTAGDVVHINRGVRHYFRNTGKEPAASFVVFSPPFDGRDTVTAEVPAAEQPPAEERRPWWRLWGRGSTKRDESRAAPTESESP